MQKIKDIGGAVLLGALFAIGVRQCAIMENNHLREQDRLLLEQRHAQGLISTADKKLIEWRLEDERKRLAR